MRTVFASLGGGGGGAEGIGMKQKKKKFTWDGPGKF